MEEFVIEAVRAERLRQASGVDMEQFVASLVKPTAAMARAPISKFHVGAVGLGSSGRIFRGVNLEFKGLPLNHSVHAEQFLVANAAQNGEKKLVFIAVSAAPCGHCRQFLQELRAAGDIRILVTDGKDPEPQPLSYFLPHRFGPEDLLHKDFPLLLESRSNGLHPTLTSASATPVVAAPNGSICTKCDHEIAQNGASPTAGTQNSVLHSCTLHANFNPQILLS
jgi:cytidine deaminase